MTGWESVRWLDAADVPVLVAAGVTAASAMEWEGLLPDDDRLLSTVRVRADAVGLLTAGVPADEYAELMAVAAQVRTDQWLPVWSMASFVLTAMWVGVGWQTIQEWVSWGLFERWMERDEVMTFPHFKVADPAVVDESVEELLDRWLVEVFERFPGPWGPVAWAAGVDVNEAASVAARTGGMGALRVLAGFHESGTP